MAPERNLRERQRIAVRQELCEAALDLFVEHGFDQVSVSDITDRVGMAQRTFFRHFDTKEDVALAWLDDTGPVIREALRRAPLDEAPMVSLAHAFLSVGQEHPDLAGRSELVHRLATASPRLMAGLTLRQRSWSEQLARTLSQRLGVSPVVDPRPRLWASLAMTIAVTSAETAIAAGTDPRAAMERAFASADQLFASQSHDTR